MIPRTVKMAKAVESTFTTPQLEDYGNIILNGYIKVGPNTTGRRAWQYAETTTPPVALPSVSSVNPSLKGWTTNYMDYYTQLQPNSYGTDPGTPTNFFFNIHSHTKETGPVSALAGLQSGNLYTPGTYTGVPALGGSGQGATLNVTVDASGYVTSCTLNSPGTGYAVGDGFTADIGAYDFPFAVFVAAITPVDPAGEPKWAQPPRRFNQLQVSNTTPPQNINNPAVIQYSFIHPVADNPLAPPIDTLN